MLPSIAYFIINKNIVGRKNLINATSFIGDSFKLANNLFFEGAVFVVRRRVCYEQQCIRNIVDLLFYIPFISFSFIIDIQPLSHPRLSSAFFSPLPHFFRFPSSLPPESPISYIFPFSPPFGRFSAFVFFSASSLRLPLVTITNW